jgi:hypothetical protein
MADAADTRIFGSAVKVLAVEVVTLLLLFALQQVYTR